MTGDGSRSTVCPACAVGCRLARGEGSRAEGREGPANPEGRLCRSGIRAFERRQDRLTRPQVRRDGELVAVGWETAIRRVVDGLGRVRETHGPDALAFMGTPRGTNEENYRLGKLARLLGTNNVDNRARLCHEETARALSGRLGWPATTNSLADLRDADVILVVGANPARRQPVAFNSVVRPAVVEGTTLVHVDPVGNATTRLADVHLAPRPGMDGVVLDVLSALVREAGGIDRAFVADRTNGVDGFEAGLERLDCQRAASVAGVDREALRDVAARIAERNRTAAVTGTGIEGGRGDASAADALLNLLLLSGNVGRRGTGLHLFRGLANEQGATDAGCVPDRLPGHQPVTDPDARRRLGAEWGVEPPATPGLDVRALLEAFGDGIRGALVVGENPAVSKRDPEWIERRLDALELLVLVDVARSETTPHADVVLPAASALEKAGTVTNLDRQIQRLQPVEAPPGEARTDLRILGELGSRLLDDAAHFEGRTPASVFEEMGRVMPMLGGVSYDDIGGSGYRWPDDEAVLYRDAFEAGAAAFVDVQPLLDPSADEALELVTGGRASGADHLDERPLRVHPDDAARRGIRAGDTVVVSGEGATVEATADTDDAVRQGTVYLHAAVADPLVRAGVRTVTVTSVERPRPE